MCPTQYEPLDVDVDSDAFALTALDISPIGEMELEIIEDINRTTGAVANSSDKTSTDVATPVVTEYSVTDSSRKRKNKEADEIIAKKLEILNVMLQSEKENLAILNVRLQSEKENLELKIIQKRCALLDEQIKIAQLEEKNKKI